MVYSVCFYHHGNHCPYFTFKFWKSLCRKVGTDKVNFGLVEVKLTLSSILIKFSKNIYLKSTTKQKTDKFLQQQDKSSFRSGAWWVLADY